MDKPTTLTLYQLFELQAQRTPKQLAIISKNHAINYETLAIYVNSFSSYLINKGVLSGNIVGVYTERCPELIVAILSIMKIGAYYLPLDIHYPEERLTYMVGNSRCSYILYTQKKMSALLDNINQIKIALNTVTFSDQNLVTNFESSVACIIYTSGSTGQPKGVLLRHDAIINRLEWMWEKYPYHSEERCVMKTPICFVDSIAEIFSPILRGVSLVIAPDQLEKDVNQFIDFLSEQKVTRILLVPSLLSVMLLCEKLNIKIPDLYFWVVSGETLPLELALQFKKIMPDCVLINLYGSTEVTADISFYEVNLSEINGYVPIGQPIINNDIYILDNNLCLVKQGVEGEIVVSGIGLAEGYLHEENSEKFVTINIDNNKRRAFRMGDRGRYNLDGYLQYLGRKDDQIKVRGNKVNLNEIERYILGELNIHQCVVMPEFENGLVYRLTAFITVNLKNYPDFLNNIKNKFPDYMLPNQWITLKKFPLLPNGKINKAALTKKLMPQKSDLSTRANQVSNSCQLFLLNVITKILNTNDIQIYDNFFDLGASSLDLAKIAITVNNASKVNITVLEIAHNPSVYALSEYINTDKSVEKKDNSSMLTIYFTTPDAPNLFIIHPITGLSVQYLKLKKHITSYNVYAISNPFFGQEDGFESIVEMAKYYIDIIFSVQKKGDFHLAGWSFGGVVALEMASQLKNRGLTVDKIILIDSFNIQKLYANQISNASLQHEVEIEMNWLREQKQINLDLPEGILFKNEVCRNIKMLLRHNPNYLNETACLIKADIPEINKYPLSVDEWNGWACLIKKIEKYTVQEKHDDLFKEKSIAKIALALNHIMNTRNLWDKLTHLFSITELEQLQNYLNHNLPTEEIWLYLTQHYLNPEWSLEKHQAIFNFIYAHWQESVKGPKPIWIPTQEYLKKSRFQNMLLSKGFNSFDEYHQWTIDNEAEYIKQNIENKRVVFDEQYKTIYHSDEQNGAIWLQDGKLNCYNTFFGAEYLANRALVFSRDGNTIETMDYESLKKLVDNVAISLINHGIRPRDTIAICAHYTVESIAVFFAAVKIGCIINCVMSFLQKREIEYQLNTAPSKLIFTDDYHTELNEESPLEKLSFVDSNTLILLSKKNYHYTKHLLDWNQFLSHGDHSESPTYSYNIQETVYICYSSGTTSRPKAIPITHEMILAQTGHNIPPNEITYWPTSLGAIVGSITLFGVFFNHSTLALYYLGPKDPGFSNFIKQSGITRLGTYPRVQHYWRKNDSLHHEDLQQIKLIYSTGESADYDDQFDLLRKSRYKPLLEICGGTELGKSYLSSFDILPVALGFFNAKTPGRNFVLIAEGKLSTTIGEVFMNSGHFSLSRSLLNDNHHDIYFKNSPIDSSGNPLRRVGDVIEIMPKGFFKLIGRTGDTLNIAGHLFHPISVESYVNQISYISESAAIQIYCHEKRALLVLYIVLEGKHPCYEYIKKDLEKHLKESFNAEIILHDVILCKSLPLTAVGKIKRSKLRKEYKLKVNSPS